MTATDGLKTTARTIDVENIHSNVTPEILEITIDKLRIVLLEQDRLLASSNEWHTPLALLATIVLVFCTTNFKQFIGVSADTWAAVFIISGGLTVLWLGRALWRRKKHMSVDELIESMKKQKANTTQT